MVILNKVHPNRMEYITEFAREASAQRIELTASMPHRRFSQNRA